MVRIYAIRSICSVVLFLLYVVIFRGLLIASVLLDGANYGSSNPHITYLIAIKTREEVTLPFPCEVLEYRSTASEALGSVFSCFGLLIFP